MCTPGSPAQATLMSSPAQDDLSPVNVTAQKMPTPDQSAAARLALMTQSAGVVTSAAGAFAKANADRQAALYNVQVANSQALNAQRVGDSTAQKLYSQTNQLKGTQRATMAASGVSLASGSPLDVLTSTDVMGATDQATNKYNTQLDVNAANNKAAYYKSQASNVSPFVSAGSTLITGAGTVASKWYTDTKDGLFKNGFFGG